MEGHDVWGGNDPAQNFIENHDENNQIQSTMYQGIQ